MCLGVPMQIVELKEFEARCEAKGIERRVSLFLLQDDSLQEGDHVLVHVGYAIQKLTPDDAEERWRFLDEAMAAEREAETT